MISPEWQQQRDHAEQIWRAGVKSVDSMQLVRNAISVTEAELTICDQTYLRSDLGRILVVGAGKAGAGMAAGFEAALPDTFLEKHVSGWINIPADCMRPLKQLHLHPARPAGINEPTAEAVRGTSEILKLVSSLKPNDLCVVLISGGGSALLPAPVPGVTLEDKLTITRNLAKAGASIEELNTVRSSLSIVKAGGLLRACQSKRMITLIISDVVGDPLETIASGPTVLGENKTGHAIEILERYLSGQVPENVSGYLVKQKMAPDKSSTEHDSEIIPQVVNIILGNNAVAVKAASDFAKQIGYDVICLGSAQIGIAKEVGIELIKKAREFKKQYKQPLCIICGGESVVPISPDSKPGKGGRNQEIALAALTEIAQTDQLEILLLAAGTDGEDGPTDAAGAFADAETLRRANRLNLEISDFLKRHDSYRFFQACKSLLITGPTDTNVMDLCIILAK